MRYLKKFLAPVLITLLAAMLLATIYFTLLDLPWIAFLGGVLFSAIAALTSQTARAQWMVVRRTRQYERTKGLLTVEVARREFAAEELAVSEARFRQIGNALAVMIVFVDRDERCGYHNRAFQHWCGRSGDRIDGMPLREVAGNVVYNDLQSHSISVLAGREIRYDATWPSSGGEHETMSVMLVPYPPGIERTTGYHVLVTRAPAAPAVAQTGDQESAADFVMGEQEGGESVYLQSMTEQLIGGSDPRNKLVQALQDDQFILFAQEIRPLAGDAAEGRCMEVLLRLQEEEQNMLPPGGFFPVAERYNLMGDIDRWVVRNLLNGCAARQLEGNGWQMPLYCVNLSSASLCDPAFARYVQGELERCNIPGSGLCFEITEGDLIRHHHEVRGMLSALRPLGCRFTVDGFGGVRVSFAPFRDLKFDFLKIDGMIIQSILTERSELAKTTAIVLACRKIGVRTIAGLVESEETITRLREIGVDYVQGFGVSRPAPLAHMESADVAT